jgi:hypothetical protein
MLDKSGPRQSGPHLETTLRGSKTDESEPVKPGDGIWEFVLWILRSFWMIYSPAVMAVVLETVANIRSRVRGVGKAVAKGTHRGPSPWAVPILWWGLATTINHIRAFEVIGSGFLLHQAYIAAASLIWLLMVLLLQGVAHLAGHGLCRPRFSFLWIFPILMELFDATLIAYTTGFFDLDGTQDHYRTILEFHCPPLS